MKRLTLIRHAEASKADATLPDFERMLNQRGERDAPMMGRRLAQQRFRPDLVLSSPARRALRTATLVLQELGLPDNAIVTKEHIYEAEVSDLLDVVQQIDDVFINVVLFGHNPGIHELSSVLIGRRLEQVPTGAVITIDMAIGTWQDVAPGSGTLVSFDHPGK